MHSIERRSVTGPGKLLFAGRSVHLSARKCYRLGQRRVKRGRLAVTPTLTKDECLNVTFYLFTSDQRRFALCPISLHSKLFAQNSFKHGLKSPCLDYIGKTNN